jgi:diketogulonate reductase-like aldo/keto reductase
VTNANSVQLNNGVAIPQIGLGVYQSPRGKVTQRAVLDALRIGYRHIDTARIYGNEEDVGIAVRESGLRRDEVFVTTKLWNDDQGYDSALRAAEASLSRLGLESIDLYLLHWPVAGRRLDSWRALERLLGDGRVRAIGVSNFMVNHLEELLTHAKVVPSVNQIELTPFLQQRDVCAFCAKHGIAIEAYSPLTRGIRLGDETIVDVAKRSDRTAAQVLIRWSVQHGFIVLPKSTHTPRIAENFDLGFELSASDMARLDGLDEGLVTGWDPRGAP